MNKVKEDLIDCLSIIGLNEEEIVAVLLVLDKGETQRQLLEWMANQSQELTRQAVIKQIVTMVQQ